MTHRFYLVLILIFAFHFQYEVYSQTLFPEYKPVYIDTEIPRIDIIIANTDLQAIYQSGNEESNVEYSATFVFNSSELTDTIYNVGIRLRGNTSRYSQKKSFKVSFNTYVAGQKFQGLEKLNLNGEHNDPSIVRSKLCWDMLNSIGVPASRANHVRLYINNQYYGLYISVEHIDDQFVKLHFGNNNGNLYKCLYPADLTYRGTNPDSYKFTENGYRVYDLKNNLEADDYSDIAKLIQIINQTSTSDLPAKLEPVFNVNSFLKYLAVEALVGHWDGYSYNKNNFYLYKNTLTGKFEFIPYDIDNTFGIDWFGIDWATRNVLSWVSNEDRPLNKKILSVDVYKRRYQFYLKQLLKNQFNTSTLTAKANAIHYRIRQYASIDPYRSLDYGWSFSDFDNSYTQALGAHVKYGLIPYIEKRSKYALSQISASNVPPVISNVYHKAYSYKIPIKIAATVDDEATPSSVVLTYWLDDDMPQRVDMKFDGKLFYIAQIKPTGKVFSRLSYYITATDASNLKTREPLYGNYSISLSANSNLSLCINEVMTSNSHTFADEYGDYSDWIELYNYGRSPISLGDINITDNLEKQGKWQLPNLVIYPGEFLLFWADDSTSKGSMHLPFKLNSEGEDIGLFTSKELGYKYIDGYSISAILKNHSLGYYPNSEGLPLELKTPTPGFSNVKTDESHRTILPEISVYPNPFSTTLNIEFSFAPSSDYTVSIYSVAGVLVAQKKVDVENANSSFVWDITNTSIPTGIYFVSVIVHEKNPVVLKSKRVMYLSTSKQ
ncbi:MAG: CotH kinase family protein [Bacteroidales bacterium]